MVFMHMISLLISHIWYHIWTAGLCVPHRPLSQQPQPPRDLRCGVRFRYEREQLTVVREAPAAVPVHPAPQSRSYRGRCAPSGGDSGLLQHLWARRSYAGQHHAARRRANALWFRQLCSTSKSLPLPRQECAGAGAHDPLLRRRQCTSDHSPQLARPAARGRNGRHAAQPRKRQPPLRSQLVDVEIRPGAGAKAVRPKVHGGKGEAPARGAGKGSRDAQAPQARGRGSGQRGRRGRRVALKHSIILQAYIYAGAAAN